MVVRNPVHRGPPKDEEKYPINLQVLVQRAGEHECGYRYFRDTNNDKSGRNKKSSKEWL